MHEIELGLADTLLEAAKLTRDATAAIMRGIAASGHAKAVLDAIDADAAAHGLVDRINGFGVKLQVAIDAYELARKGK